MTETELLNAIQEFIDANDGQSWRERARSLLNTARSEGMDGGLNELVSWFGGDLDNVG